MSQFDSADVDERRAEDRLARRVADVARERERDPEAGRRPLTAAITGCGVARSCAGSAATCAPGWRSGRAPRRCRRCPAPARSRAGRRRRRTPRPAPVRTIARHERSAAMRRELVVQRRAQLGRHRVQLVGAVERHEPHVRRRALGQDNVAHLALLSCLSAHPAIASRQGSYRLPGKAEASRN